MNRFHQVYLSLGSNIAPQVNLPQAVTLLHRSVNILALSGVWETSPVKGSGPNFLNAAALIETQFSIKDLRSQILRPIESQLGRVRTPDPNAPRTIDLDILIYDNQVIESDLWKFAYLCVPMAQIASEYAHPNSGETLSKIADRLARSTYIHPHPLLLT